MSFWSASRLLSLLGFLGPLLLLVTAVYLQYGLGISPCPLCLIQQGLLLLIALLFLLGLLFNFSPTTRVCLYNSNFFVAVMGILVASRQLWLESLPHGRLSICYSMCQSSIGYYAKLFHWPSLVYYLQPYAAGCTCLKGSFLHFSLAVWSGLFFSLFALMAWRQAYLSRKCVINKPLV